jgi:hypothetical protein
VVCTSLSTRAAPGRPANRPGTIGLVASEPSLPIDPAANLRATARDLGYLAVGFGVLGFQRAQVRRRELERRLRTAGGPWRAPAMAALALDSLAGPVADRIDATLGLAEDQIPEPARSALRQARDGGRGVRRQLRRAARRR